MNKQEAVDKIKSTLNELKELALSLKGKKDIKLEEVKADDGTLLCISGDLAVGVEVTTKDEEGNYIPLNDGDYKYNGQNITVTSGKVEKIEEIKVDEEVESPVEEADVNMDKKEVKAGVNPTDYKSVKRVDDYNTYYTESGIVEGAEIFRIDGDGAKQPLWVGTTLLEDGSKITVEINDEGKSIISKIEGSTTSEVLETENDIEEDVEVNDEEKVADELSSSTEQRLSKIEQGFAKTLDLLDQLLNKSSDISNEKKELEIKVQELSALPGDDTIEDKLKNTKVEMSETERRIERMKTMARSL